MGETGEVERLFIARKRRRPMLEVAEVAAVVDQGFDGCIHGRPGSRRQVLLIDRETLGELGLEAGAVRENVTTRGIAIQQARKGDRVRVGGAVLEVTGPCEPCERMDEIRPGLRMELQGRRGVLCRVVEGGLIRRGDVIELVGLSRHKNGMTIREETR